MNDALKSKIETFVNEHIGEFHTARIARLQAISLSDVLKKKNPYLFRAKNLNNAAELVASILDAFLSSSEEKIFGDFLEKLAIFISQETINGQKSSAGGVDLEFDRDGVRYIVSIKSGPNWGNSSQYQSLKQNFRKAKARLGHHGYPVQPVLGICYGKNRDADNGEYIKRTGQSFWYFLSGNSELYTEIIEPIGFEAKRHNDAYAQERDRIFNKFTQQFLDEYCQNGLIDWEKLVRFNSCNVG